MSKDPRKKHLETLASFTLRIESNQKPIILLCGGQENHKSEEYLSLRDSIIKNNTKLYFEIPENIKQWQNDSIFRDLVEFETELAAICTMVVLIIESEGSIAELGAFSQFTELRQKMLIIRPYEYSKENSFINLGILRFIERENKNSVRTYDWSINKPSEIDKETIFDSLSDISTALEEYVGDRNFNHESQSHVTILIYELINLFTALSLTEIITYLKSFNIEINHKKLKMKLFLLEEFQLVTKEEYGDSKFYLLGNKEFFRMSYHDVGKEKFDRLRIQTSVKAYYGSTDSEKNRARVIRRVLGAKK